MNSLPKFLIVCILAAVVGACSGSDSKPVPRPHAYPRLDLPLSFYTFPDSLPLRHAINNKARVRIKSPQAFDIIYPTMGVTVYCTLIPARRDSFDILWEGRLKRIDTNLAGAPTHTVESRSKEGFHGMVVVTETVSQTPVQLLATNADRSLIYSATSFVHDRTAPERYDSIAPMYTVLQHDLAYALSFLAVQTPQ